MDGAPMKALCIVYNMPDLRFTPNHCDGFLHLGLKADLYPYGILANGIGWGWHVLDFGGLWKILPECAYFLEAQTVNDAVKDGRARIVNRDWRHPATGSVFANACILVEPRTRNPLIFEKEFWHGECVRCGTCCSVPRRKTGKPCEYLKFLDKRPVG